MEYFERLGAWVEERWSAMSRDEATFPELAARALEAHAPREQLDLEALIDEILDPRRPAARQLAPLGAFGQPGFTAYYGRGFVVDVYFWTGALSAIHDHPFRGVFTIVKGESVHATYSFEETRRLGARARLGTLTLRALELLEEGQSARFGEGEDGLVHALLHVPIPSVSMVVRTIRTEGYFRYFTPGVALAMDEPDELLGRQLSLLDMIRASGDPSAPRRLARFLEHADFELAFRALSRAWTVVDDDERARLLAIAHERHGDAADVIAPAIEAALRVHEADTVRASLRDADDRLVATAFVLADGRERLLALIGQRHADPLARLHRFLDEAGSFAPDEEASRVIAHALADGHGVDGALKALREAYGDAAMIDREDEVRAYCARSMLAPLTR